MSKRVYLCGAVDKSPDHGAAWRQEVSVYLRDRGVVPINPLELQPAVGEDFDKYFSDDALWKRWVVEEDLNALVRSDMVLVRACHLCGKGTLAEVQVARWARLPIVTFIGDAHEVVKYPFSNGIFWEITKFGEIQPSQEHAVRAIIQMCYPDRGEAKERGKTDAEPSVHSDPGSGFHGRRSIGDPSCAFVSDS